MTAGGLETLGKKAAPEAKVCEFVTVAGLHRVRRKGIMVNRLKCGCGEGDGFVARMFRVLGFWTLVIALMAFAGDMIEMSLLFFAQTVFFVMLGYLNLTERTYILTFWGYMVVAFLGFTYWSVFEMDLPF